MEHEQELRKGFLKYATDYFEAAKYFQRSGWQSNQVVGNLNWIAAELSLKVLAVGHNILVTHDLDEVTQHLVANGVLDNNKYNYLKPLYAHITGSATSFDEARYPSVNPTYWDNVTEPQIDQALEGTSGVQTFVKKKLRSLGYVP